jgi:hypothetical protein
VKIRHLPDCLDTPVPFHLDIDIRVLCFKGFFHFVKWLEQASSRDHFEDCFWLLLTGAATRSAAQQGNQEE